MLPVITSMSATNVKVTWIAPNSGSLTISSYLIEVLSGDKLSYY